MPQYVGPAQFSHDQPQRVGVLLVNLGTPDAPTPGAVRRFLAQFLGDPRVVEAPRWLWWPALHGVILRTRPSRSAHAYQQIWTDRGSPLMFYTRDLATKLQSALSEQLGSDVVLALGMTYGNPSIDTALTELRSRNVSRLIVLPLYPQYSGTTSASVFDQVTSILQRWRWVPELRFVMQYHDDDAYIASIVQSIEQHWATQGRKHLLFSFHGIPKSYLLAGDPYHCQCLTTARLISERLQLKEAEWSVSFQSQIGRLEWLRPYTDELLTRYARAGTRNVTVVCPGFAIDCLETLEEIALRNRQTFLSNGGVAYDYVPALNDSDLHIAVLTGLIKRHAQGWPLAADAQTLAVSAARARRAGATH